MTPRLYHVKNRLLAVVYETGMVGVVILCQGKEIGIHYQMTHDARMEARKAPFRPNTAMVDSEVQPRLDKYCWQAIQHDLHCFLELCGFSTIVY